MELNEKERLARQRVCLPLDNLTTLEKLTERVEELSPVVGIYKIGKGSFTRFGHDALDIVEEHGAEFFLDLKYHDIPNTVKDAAMAATEIGAYMFNVHALGGYAMMKAAREGVDEASETYLGLRKPIALAVTILTSIEQDILKKELKIDLSVEEMVLHLARLAEKAGMDGIVCSAADLAYVKDLLPDDFVYVTPGIKGPRTPAGTDQKRVFTPGNAIQDGSSILVVGRAITGPPTKEERLQAGHEVLQDMAKYL